MYHREIWRMIKSYKISPIIKLLILSDFLIWSSYNLLAPVFAIFVTDKIKGANLEVVGIAASLYAVFKVLVEIPVGIYIDRTKSEKDDLYAAVIGTLAMAAVYFAYVFVNSVWELYVLQAVLGVSAAFAYPGWLSIFSRHVDQERRAFEWSLYDVTIGVGIAFASAIGAFVADFFGFDVLFVIVGIFSLCGTFALLSVKNKIYI